jgi:uncharacterized membrane-anchored protein YjiN (DUF445 family)
MGKQQPEFDPETVATAKETLSVVEDAVKRHTLDAIKAKDELIAKRVNSMFNSFLASPDFERGVREMLRDAVKYLVADFVKPQVEREMLPRLRKVVEEKFEEVVAEEARRQLAEALAKVRAETARKA